MRLAGEEWTRPPALLALAGTAFLFCLGCFGFAAAALVL